MADVAHVLAVPCPGACDRGVTPPRVRACVPVRALCVSLCASGWEYEVQEWRPELTEEKSYTFNYLPQRISKRMRNLGPRGARVQFHKPTENNSQWINHHHTDFGEHKWRSKDAAAKSGKKA